ncbi:uncharacterized protein G2W53_022901 [Senna tora]|uniref:Uncharacterized protein n=1 Tax=Senna tora TaxID=362788 RepID=A0A834TNH2_9FABA|nr:uncharacterized protein G2W53_022901 [Senna tora]
MASTKPHKRINTILACRVRGGFSLKAHSEAKVMMKTKKKVNHISTC